MLLKKPNGTEWQLADVGKKLSLRARLPGAFVYDKVAHSLRNARDRGVPALERVPLAFASSWLVNSPAPSKVLRRWALPPQFDVWLALIGALEGPLQSAGEWAPVRVLVSRLGDEPFAVEAVSKVLALLLPDTVPLMPEPARTFLFGEGGAAGADGFVEVARWFTETTRPNREDLDAWAAAHDEVPLSGAQVLDRMLWFDSEGFRHFSAEAEDATNTPA